MKRCLGCMNLINDDAVICPECGYVAGTGSSVSSCLQPGITLGKRYLIGKMIGGGAFGCTYVAWDLKLDRRVAIREYLPGEFAARAADGVSVIVFEGEKKQQFERGKEKFSAEAKKLAQFQSEAGIVEVYDCFEANNTSYYAMEYLEGELLQTRIERDGKIAVAESLKLIKPVIESMIRVNAAGMLHRAIAPDNIFLTKEGGAKLIDFAAARSVTATHSRSLTMLVKTGFSPEEQYRSSNAWGSYTDVYSLAATLYQMITGTAPVDAMERRLALEKGKKDPLKPARKLDKHIPENIEAAIHNAMIPEAKDRTPDMETLKKELYSDQSVARRNLKIDKLKIYKWPKWLRVGMPVALMVLVLGAGFFAFGKSSMGKRIFSGFGKQNSQENMISVPKVEGLEQNEGIALLENAGFRVKIVDSIESEYIEPGYIVLQGIPEGRMLAAGSIVELKISKGGAIKEAENGKATVPYLVGASIEQAKADLAFAGLGEPEIEEKEDKNIAKGHVISQSVDYGTELDEGSVIKLVVSKGWPEDEKEEKKPNENWKISATPVPGAVTENAENNKTTPAVSGGSKATASVTAKGSATPTKKPTASVKPGNTGPAVSGKITTPAAEDTPTNTPTNTPTAKKDTPTPEPVYTYYMGDIQIDKEQANDTTAGLYLNKYGTPTHKLYWFKTDSNGNWTTERTEEFLEIKDYYYNQCQGGGYADGRHMTDYEMFLYGTDIVSGGGDFRYRRAFKYWPEYYSTYGIEMDDENDWNKYLDDLSEKLYWQNTSRFVDEIDKYLAIDPDSLTEGTRFGGFTKYDEGWEDFDSVWKTSAPSDTRYTKFTSTGKSKTENGSKYYEYSVKGYCYYYKGDKVLSFHTDILNPLGIDDNLHYVDDWDNSLPDSFVSEAKKLGKIWSVGRNSYEVDSYDNIVQESFEHHSIYEAFPYWNIADNPFCVYSDTGEKSYWSHCFDHELYWEGPDSGFFDKLFADSDEIKEKWILNDTLY